MERPKFDSGITIVSVIITVIIMLILAGVAINIALDDNGLIKQAKQAVSLYEDARVARTARNVESDIRNCKCK